MWENELLGFDVKLCLHSALQLGPQVLYICTSMKTWLKLEKHLVIAQGDHLNDDNAGIICDNSGLFIYINCGYHALKF